MSEMSNGELARRLNEMSQSLREGFAGVNTRIEGLTAQVREQNGRVVKLERATDVGSQRMLNIEREVFRDGRVVPDDDAISLTRRDLKVAVAVIVAAFAVIRWLPALLTAGQGAP